MMAEIFIHVFNRSISASWLILVVVLMRMFLKRAPKWVICVLWCMVGVRLFLPISIESIFSLIPSGEIVPSGMMYELSPQINSGITSVDQVVNPVIQESLAPNITNSINPLQIVVGIGSWLWILGIVMLLLYMVVTCVGLHKRVREAVRLEKNIFQSGHIQSPFVFGMVRPRIYVPFSLEGEELDCVIAHEQAHIARRDYLIKPIAFLILAVYWFQPLVWLAYILLCRDIEFACDEKVLRSLGMEQKKTYSRALLSCSVGGNTSHKWIAACPVAFGEVGVKSRIKSVLNYKKPTVWILALSVIACVVCGMCFMTEPKEEKDTVELDEISAEGSNVLQSDAALESREAELKKQEAELKVELEKQKAELKNQEAKLKTELEKINSSISEIDKLDNNVVENKDGSIVPGADTNQELTYINSQAATFRYTPPALYLRGTAPGDIDAYVIHSDTYGWNYPSENDSEEIMSVEESGLEPMVKVKLGGSDSWIQLYSYNELEYESYTISFEVIPDAYTVREYDLLSLGDAFVEPIAETHYEELTHMDLIPRHVYEIIAVWDEERRDENGFFGTASYVFATDNYLKDAEQTEN